MAHDTPILDLGPLLDRPKVRIDGKLYEMRTADEFTYLIFRQHQRRFMRLGKLLRKKRTSAAEEKEQARLLDEFTRLFVLAPEAVHAKMRDTHRFEIIKSFSDRLQTTRRPAAEPKRHRARPAGTK